MACSGSSACRLPGGWDRRTWSRAKLFPPEPTACCSFEPSVDPRYHPEAKECPILRVRSSFIAVLVRFDSESLGFTYLAGVFFAVFVTRTEERGPDPLLMTRLCKHWLTADIVDDWDGHLLKDVRNISACVTTFWIRFRLVLGGGGMAEFWMPCVRAMAK